MRTRRQTALLNAPIADGDEDNASANMLGDPSPHITSRKRQALEVVPNTQRTKQVGFSRKGKLMGMLSLPVEIITEIATHLTPPDLIILSRLSKGFRALLMRRSAAPIWVSAIRNVPKLPNCPEDLCEAQYAALVYSKHCSTCGAGVTKPMDPYLNVRLCNSCRAEQVVSIEEAPNRLVKSLVPQTPENDDSEPVCLRSDLEKLTSYVLRLEDPDDPAHPDGENWIQSKGDLRVARVKYARKLELFLKKMAKDRTKELEALKSQRRDNIKQRLESAGWSKRDWLFRSEVAEDWVKLVEAPKLLTDRTWESLYPKLVPYLEANRKERLERASRDRYRTRERRLRALLVGMKKKDVVFKVEQSVLKAQAGGSTAADDTAALTESDQEEYESEDDWQDAHSDALLIFALRRPFPPMVETFQFPSIAPLLENDVDANPFEVLFDEARDDTEEAIRSWRLRVEDELLGAFLASSNNTTRSDLALNFPLPPKYASAVSDLSPSLRKLLRADTVFRVVNDRVCPSPLYYPEMFSIYQQRFGGHFRSRGGIDPRLGYTWNTDRVRRFDEGVAAAKAILDELGRKDAAQFEMRCLGAIFACGQCSDKMSRTWNQIVHHHAEALSRAHAYEQCADPIKSSTIYNDPHTISSGPRPRGKSKPLVIIYTSEKAKTLYPKHQDLKSVVQCNMCSQLGVRFVGTRSVVLKHAKAVHSVVNPKANVYTTTEQEDPDWHWTPRRWERVSESSGETDVPTGRDLVSKVDYYGARAYWTDFKRRSRHGP